MMGLFQFTVMLEVFLDGDSRQRGFRAADFICPRGLIVIFMFSRVLYEVRLGQLSLYPCRVFLYLFVYLYVLLK